MSSRKVLLGQVRLASQQFMPKEISDEIIKKVGSSWIGGPDGRATNDVVKGLTEAEEELFLPSFLGVSLKDVKFREAVREFWFDYSIPVPSKPISLEVGTEKKTVVNEKGDRVDVDYPINLKEYMDFNFAKKHPAVAFTPEELDNISLFEFYLEDLAAKKEEEIKVFEEVDSALEDYVIMFKHAAKSENYDKVNWVLNYMLMTSVNKDDHFKVADRMSPKEKKMQMRSMIDKDPTKFKEVLGDPNLETKALLVRLVKSGILEKNGNSYFYGDEIVGSDEKEAVAKLKDSTFSGTLLRLKEQLKQLDKTS